MREIRGRGESLVEEFRNRFGDYDLTEREESEDLLDCVLGELVECWGGG